MRPSPYSLDEVREIRAHALARMRSPQGLPPDDFPIVLVQNRYRSSNGDSGRLWVAIAAAIPSGHVLDGFAWERNRLQFVVCQVCGERPRAVEFWRDPPPYIATDDDPTRAVQLLREQLAAIADLAVRGSDGVNLNVVPAWYLDPGDERWEVEGS